MCPLPHVAQVMHKDPFLLKLIFHGLCNEHKNYPIERYWIVAVQSQNLLGEEAGAFGEGGGGGGGGGELPHWIDP